MMIKVKFKKGLRSDLPKEGEAGCLSLATDTGELFYCDTTGGPQKKIGDNFEIKVENGKVVLTNTTDNTSTEGTLPIVSTSANGLMTKEDKSKLDGVAAGANNYSLPTASASTLGGVKIGANLSISEGKLSANNQSWSQITGKPSTFPPGTHTHDLSEVSDTSSYVKMTPTERTKLSSIATGAEVNQNAFSKIAIGSATIEADAKQDIIKLVAGSNVTITSDDTLDGITISAKDTTYSVATSSANGLMSKSDKSKLDGIATGANNYSHPTYTSKSSGLYKVTVDSKGHVSATTAVAKSDITALGIPGQDTMCAYESNSSNQDYPLLFKNSPSSTTTAGTPYFDTGITVNPTTDKITAKLFKGDLVPTMVHAGTSDNYTISAGFYLIHVKMKSDGFCYSKTFYFDGANGENLFTVNGAGNIKIGIINSSGVFMPDTTTTGVESYTIFRFGS